GVAGCWLRTAGACRRDGWHAVRFKKGETLRRHFVPRAPCAVHQRRDELARCGPASVSSYVNDEVRRRRKLPALLDRGSLVCRIAKRRNSKVSDLALQQPAPF